MGDLLFRIVRGGVPTTGQAGPHSNPSGLAGVEDHPQEATA